MDHQYYQEIHSEGLTSKEERQRDEMKENWKASKVGRGIWNMFMTVIYNIVKINLFNLTVLQKFAAINYCFTTYCKDAYCLKCREHAIKFLNKRDIVSVIHKQKKDREIRDVYFSWIYNFRVSANKNAGHESPSEEEAIDYFAGHESNINPSDFDYELIENGVFHCLFILTTECHRKEHVNAVYVLISMYMPYLPKIQRKLYNTYISNNDFSQALKDDISTDDLCISLFDWIYSMYKFINTSSGVKIYSKRVIRDAYYNISYCSKGCDS